MYQLITASSNFLISSFRLAPERLKKAFYNPLLSEVAGGEYNALAANQDVPIEGKSRSETRLHTGGTLVIVLRCCWAEIAGNNNSRHYMLDNI